MTKIDFTIFTPTYNRANTLSRVYESLIAQSFKNFEWVVVDDGSTDNTKALIMEWQKQSSFPIRYFFQENQGKHIAFNKGVKEAQGEFFIPLDSDDACLDTALERFKQLWDEIPESDKVKFSGVCVLCQDQHGNKVGDAFPKNKMDSDSCELLYKYKIKGEKWGFHRTSVLQEYPFPEIQGVSFIPECIVWHAIAKKFKIRCVNEMLRIYYIENTLSKGNTLAKTESLNLTSTLSSVKARKAKRVYYKWVLNNDIGWFWVSPSSFLKAAFQYLRYSIFLEGWSK